MRDGRSTGKFPWIFEFSINSISFPQTWIVTGATGFVGCRLVTLLAEELLASDNKTVKIYCTVRAGSDTSLLAQTCKQALLSQMIEVIPVDLTNPDEIRRKFPKNVTYIYHCAAKGCAPTILFPIFN